jgi:hypothetical protein
MPMSETIVFNFRKTFLNLTKKTVPYSFEHTLKKYLPEGIQEDAHENYFIRIGESETLFTSHLDTYVPFYEPSPYAQKDVNHVIKGNIISTDGTTILGGDNKAGVTILLYMISQGVPGTYYFFKGEEKGCIGSRAALVSDVAFFSQFKRAVAFDRRETGSIITFQKDRRCCSEEFSKALASEFLSQGLVYGADPTGYSTDSAVFMNVIPECTNLSAGVWNEHRFDEYVNIKVVEQIAKAASTIKWDKLPSERLVATHFNYAA